MQLQYNTPLHEFMGSVDTFLYFAGHGPIAEREEDFLLIQGAQEPWSHRNRAGQNLDKANVGPMPCTSACRWR